MRFLAQFVRGLHLFLGISTPRPEQERFFVVFWTAVAALFIAMFVALLYAMKYVPL